MSERVEKVLARINESILKLCGTPPKGCTEGERERWNNLWWKLNGMEAGIRAVYYFLDANSSAYGLEKIEFDLKTIERSVSGH